MLDDLMLNRLHLPINTLEQNHQILITDGRLQHQYFRQSRKLPNISRRFTPLQTHDNGLQNHIPMFLLGSIQQMPIKHLKASIEYKMVAFEDLEDELEVLGLGGRHVLAAVEVAGDDLQEGLLAVGVLGEED
jgi:hypothetical protein